MPLIRITDETRQILLAKAPSTFIFSGEQQANGDWCISLEWQTAERLRNHRLAGETLSDTIARVLSIADGVN